ncbi:MAG: hypothetical protein COZ18_05840 [Flexibacter sp. CG_4_10_14_3_um_filter_32_15]|nr:MAG: hypothetical protein COZ18_05840 [Flexibacter sp. CG_4_10_14_3_um_filter_32_15]
MRHLYTLFGSLILLFALFFFTKNQYTYQSYPLNWDEVDYVNATKLGVLTNAFEIEGMDLISYVQLGLAKKQKDEQKVAQIATQLPNENLDPLLKRHLHPTLPIYYWSFFTDSDPIQAENNFRWSNIILGWLTACSFIASLWIIGKLTPSSYFYMCIVASFFITHSLSFAAFTLLNYHTFHLLATILYLGILVKYIEKQSLDNNSNYKYAYLLGVGVAILFLTLEMALVVVGGSFIAIILIGKWKLLIDFPSMWRAFVSFLITLVLFWAGAIWKGAMVKSWLNYAYRIFGDGNAEYKKVSLFHNWIELIKANPTLFTFIFLGLSFAIYQIYKKKLPFYYFVPFTVGLIYAVAMTPFMLHPVYVIPSLGMLLFACGLILSESKLHDYIKIGVSSFLLAVIIFNFASTNFEAKSKEIQTQRNDYLSDFETIEKIAQNTSSNKPILATGSHIIDYYTTLENSKELNRCSISNPSFCLRKDYNYINIEEDIKSKKYKMIIVLKWMNYPDEKISLLKEIGYSHQKLNIHDVFYLQKN